MEPGQELDALVMVEVFGWDLTPHEFGHDLPHGPFRAIGYDDEGLHVLGMQNPSTDIDAAFEVVEKLTADDDRKHPLHFRCHYRFHYEAENQMAAYAVFDWKLTGDSHPLYPAHAETMPHAICLAEPA
jgi:hypothetical protein